MVFIAVTAISSNDSEAECVWEKGWRDNKWRFMSKTDEKQKAGKAIQHKPAGYDTVLSDVI